jgi:hypothetical protein
MRIRTWMFAVWGVSALLFWSLGDASRVALKYQVGGWRTAYLHFFLSVVFALLVAFIPAAIASTAILIFRRKNKTGPSDGEPGPV